MMSYAKTLPQPSLALLIMLKKLLLTIAIIFSNTCLAEALPNVSYSDAPDILSLAAKCKAIQGICPHSYIVWRKSDKQSVYILLYVQGDKAIITCDIGCSERALQTGTRWVKLSDLYLVKDIQ
jgi:hypothetical protein